MNHYVYKITEPNSKKFYIGSRSCKCEPEDDDYMGSMKTWKPKDVNILQKEIIKKGFDTRDKAIEFEATVIKEHIDNKLNENYHIPPHSWHTSGRVVTDMEIELLSNRTKNTVVVRDADDNCFRVSVDDDRYKNGELVHANVGIKRSNEFKKKLSKTKKNTILVKDDDGRALIVDLDDDRLKNGELIPYSSGTCVVESCSGERFRVSVDDDRIKTGKLKKQTVPEWGIEKASEARKVKVAKYDLNENLLKTYDSLKEAASDVNGYSSAIVNCLNGLSKTSYGYKWKRINIKK